MNPTQKLQTILTWFASSSEEPVSKPALQQEIETLSKIETLIGEPLPAELKVLFEKYNGEEGDGPGCFIGHSLMNLGEVLSDLTFAKAAVKPANPYVADDAKSNDVIQRLNAVYRSLITENKWYKLCYDGSENSRGGPYFYLTPETTPKEKQILKLTKELGDEVQKLFRELKELERESYNWDFVEVEIFGDGSYTFERKNYNFSDDLTSHPPGRIKTKYFHYKWIPVISDNGGNYIGVDLDPDVEGKKGQVIIFGRDEDEMLVLADSWEQFLDFVVELIDKNPDELKASGHLHDYFKSLLIS